jgi:hypothetical protein
MFRFASFVIFFFALTFTISAQGETKPDCPLISVIGPSGIIAPGEISAYTMTVDTKEKVLELEYVWSVSSGKIVSGQGTSTIEVRDLLGSCVTATVEIRGLPKSCLTIYSETACGDPAPQAAKLDEFVGSLAKVPAERFTKAFEQAQDNPTAQVYIFISGSRRNTELSIRKKRQIIMKHISSSFGHHTQRITFVDVGKKDDFVTIWLVPAGADLPTP